MEKITTYWKLSFILLIATTIFTGACSTSSMDQTFKETAGGAIGEIILVIDEDLWKGDIGTELKEIFAKPFPGLYRSENMFELRQVNPAKLTKTLRNARNVIYVNLLNDNSEGSRIVRANYSPETLERIKADPDWFMQTTRDENAVGQETLHLFGRNKEELLANMSANRLKLRDYFNTNERKYITSRLVKGKQSETLKAAMIKEYGKSLRVPDGYRLVRMTEDFIWFREFDGEVDKNIFMSIKPYTSEADFQKENIINWRDQIGKAHIYGDPENEESFVMTEQRIPIDARNLNFQGRKFATETRGQWRTNNKSMGGSFLSYVFTDESNQNLIYLEGFIYYPNEKHRDILREIEAVLWSFTESGGSPQV
jgi:hypothetical protein